MHAGIKALCRQIELQARKSLYKGSMSVTLTVWLVFPTSAAQPSTLPVDSASHYNACYERLLARVSHSRSRCVVASCCSKELAHRFICEVALNEAAGASFSSLRDEHQRCQSPFKLKTDSHATSDTSCCFRPHAKDPLFYMTDIEAALRHLNVFVVRETYY